MHLLFDLDGTLTDSFPGISQSINQTLTTLGREVVSLDQLRPFVDARLTSIFGSLLQSEDEALIDRAVDIYRPLFDEVGIHESRVFPGIPEALTTFRAALDRAGARSDDAIMIGDRAEDIRAARAHGIGAVAVGWGYGAPEELREASPDYFAPTVADLVSYATQPASR